ncbi:LamG domain-containing protein [uncultured Thiodictyon sp.]|uniref:LamG domain-containing protein n=1 Tax=uncultured Thiodictyon sp. TaxID=1846217 RepID=UPI0026015874|nr:LamG domain-containing protein [uncultured Thiodictyon sp.]
MTTRNPTLTSTSPAAQIITAEDMPTESGHYCLEFNGIDDGVKLFDPGWQGRDFTIEFWAKRAEPNRKDRILTALQEGDGGVSESVQWLFQAGFNEENGFFVTFGRERLLGCRTPHDRDWHYWAITCQKRDIPVKLVEFYRDGVPQGGGHMPLIDFGAPSIGNTLAAGSTIYTTGFQPFKGMISELRIWDGVRTRGQILDYMYCEIPNPESQPLLLYCKLNEGKGAITNCLKPQRACELRHGDQLGQGPQWRTQRPFGFYHPPTPKGCVQATILPKEAAAAGAKWSLDGMAWKSSEESWNDVSDGSYTIQVQCPRGWRPSWPPMTVAVIGAQTVTPALRLLEDATVWIGAIPPQSYRPGGAIVEFIVHSATFDTGAVFTVTPDRPIQGSLGITDSLFRYTPSPLDKTLFNLTITASRGDASDSQTLCFTPLLAPTPEAAFFTYERPLPDPASTDYVSVVRTEDLQEEAQNYAVATRVKVDISGKTVVIAKDHPNGIYNAYNSDGVATNLNIREMNIMADVVIVRNALRLPQTNLNIWTRELRFEDCGSEQARFDLTPKALSIRAAPAQLTIAQDAVTGKNNEKPTPATPGKDGLRGGDITLRVQAVLSTATGVARFVTDGGAGQPGGLGANGPDGLCITPVKERANWKECEKNVGPIIKKYMRTEEDLEHWTLVAFYDWVPPFDFGWFVCGEPRPERQDVSWDKRNGWKPTDGVNAVAQGKSGDGGRVSSSVDICALIRAGRGVHGTDAPPCVGGKAGTPNPAIRLVASGWQPEICDATQRRKTAPTPQRHGPTAASPAPTRPWTKAPFPGYIRLP